jgi:hypothetical protein
MKRRVTLQEMNVDNFQGQRFSLQDGSHALVYNLLRREECYRLTSELGMISPLNGHSYTLKIMSLSLCLLFFVDEGLVFRTHEPSFCLSAAVCWLGGWLTGEASSVS